MTIFFVWTVYNNIYNNDVMLIIQKIKCVHYYKHYEIIIYYERIRYIYEYDFIDAMKYEKDEDMVNKGHVKRYKSVVPLKW